MDFKKTKADSTTVSRNVSDLERETGNIYETISILAKRADQISADMKEELIQKLQDFASATDNLEEVFENREQIEISKFYERLPKPVLIAFQEFMDNDIYFRNPAKDGTKADTV
ncbi:MAG: DNA-directed RNA polymerase subunit omega [Bacteroidales bacterium]